MNARLATNALCWVLLGSSIASVPGCSFPRSTAVSIPSEARDAFSRGREAEADRRLEEAEARYREAIALAPRFVDGHRAYQNLRLAAGYRGDLRREYRALLERDPSDPVFIYLFGRLASDVAVQHEACAKAVSLGPDLYSAWVGLGLTALDLRDPETAREAFESAIRLDASRSDAWRGRLLQLERTVGDDAKSLAVEIAKRLERIDPIDLDAARVLCRADLDERRNHVAFDRVVAIARDDASDAGGRFVAEFMERNGRPDDFVRMRDVVAPTMAERLGSPAWRGLAALLEERCGSPRAALEWLAAGESASESRALRLQARRLRIATGEFDHVLRDVVEDRFAAGFDLEAGADAELRALLVAPLHDRRGNAATAAVRTLYRHGLLELGIAVASAVLRNEPTNAALAELRAAGLAHRRFVRELADWFASSYRDPDADRSLDDFLAFARLVSRECLGRDVVEPAVMREYFAIGRFLDPDPEAGGGLARYFDEFGGFFVVGERLGGVVDGYLLNRIANRRMTIDGRPVLRVLGEELTIPSRIESGGGEIAGFALETFIVLNVDRARNTAERVRRLYSECAGSEPEPRVLRDAIDPASDAVASRSLREPGSVVLRVWLRSYGEYLANGGVAAAYEGVVLDAVEVHEMAHIRDAHEFLPVLDDVPRKVGLLAQNGFSGAKIEAWLEGRAQLEALAAARDPRIALAELMRELPDRDSSPPHSVGYFDVAESLVELVSRSDLTGFDRNAVIVQQLDRLRPDELRALARALRDDLGR